MAHVVPSLNMPWKQLLPLTPTEEPPYTASAEKEQQ